MEQALIYVVIAAIAGVATTLFLFITKIPAVVTVGSALLVGALVVVYARIDLGFWDPLAPIAFVANAAFAFAISFALLAVGRWLRWPFFLAKRNNPPDTSQVV
jgi:hypothetical protein